MGNGANVNMETVNLLVDAYEEVSLHHATNKEVAMAIATVVVDIACNISAGSQGQITCREAMSYINEIMESYFDTKHNEPLN